MTNQQVAASVVGYIRRVPCDQRVDGALTRTLASRPWTNPQRRWLQRIAAQTKAKLIVDRAALDDPDLIFKREGAASAG